jgi:hypothetical protein
MATTDPLTEREQQALEHMRKALEHILRCREFIGDPEFSM